MAHCAGPLLTPALCARRFQSVLDGLDDSNAAEYTRQVTDAHRLHVFDIVMQYRAIFSEADPVASRTLARGESGRAAPPPRATAARLLYSWAQHRVQLYVDTLELHLPRCATAGGSGWLYQVPHCFAAQ